MIKIMYGKKDNVFFEGLKNLETECVSNNNYLGSLNIYLDVAKKENARSKLGFQPLTSQSMIMLNDYVLNSDHNFELDNLGIFWLHNDNEFVTMISALQEAELNYREGDHKSYE